MFRNVLTLTFNISEDIIFNLHSLFTDVLANEGRVEMKTDRADVVPSTGTVTTTKPIGQSGPMPHPSGPIRKQPGSLLTRILTSTRPTVSTTSSTPSTTRTTSKQTPKPTTTTAPKPDNSNKLPRCWWEQVGPCSEPCGGCGRKKMVFFCTSSTGSKRM